ncbi:MAG: PHP domain-containing protein [Balneolaceae bacterium]
MAKADLHIHTKASDGALEVPELIKKISEKGLKIIAITDHDTIDGYTEAVKFISENNLNLEIISGVELTALWNSMEVHLLAYAFDPENEPFLTLIAKQKMARRKRMKEIVKLLNSKGVDIDYEEIRAVSGKGNMGRPHAASILIKKGYVSSIPEAFIKYLSSDKIEGIKTGYQTIQQMVEIVKQAGGVLSIAHPGPIYSRKELDELLSFGLDGIECIHPSHNFSVQRSYTQIAKTNNLLITGGSDYHGSNKSDYDPYLGTVTISQSHVDSIKRTATNRKRILT